MKLYFLRHADAVEGVEDDVRPLSPRGIEEARAIGKFLQQAEVEFDAAYSSPLVRARETAEIVLKITNDSSRVKLKLDDSLRNECEDFNRWLVQLPEARRVLLVGHAPSFPQHVRQLLAMGNPDALKLPKGGLACLETEDRRTACLKFFITPKAIGM